MLGTLNDLIDTLWNVKFYLDLMVLGDRYDLIDTLWNVKIMDDLYVDVFYF